MKNKRKALLLSNNRNPIIMHRFPGRNDKCHCRSGKKYKSCCLTNDTNQLYKVNPNSSDPK